MPCCCVGLQTALYYPWLTSWWANCTNAASVLCSACGSGSTLLCSVLAARAVVPSLGWSVLHTNTLLFATNSAAELLNMSAAIPVPFESMGVLLSISMGSGACALLDACSLSGNSRFVNVAVCQLLFSGSISLCTCVTAIITLSIISLFQRPPGWSLRLQSIWENRNGFLPAVEHLRCLGGKTWPEGTVTDLIY